MKYLLKEIRAEKHSPTRDKNYRHTGQQNIKETKVKEWIQRLPLKQWSVLSKFSTVQILCGGQNSTCEWEEKTYQKKISNVHQLQYSVSRYLNSNNKIHLVARYPDISINNCHKLKIKVDIDTDQMQQLTIRPKIKNIIILRAYEGSNITKIKEINLKITYKNRSITRFNTVKAPPKCPSILGWIISISMDEIRIQGTPRPGTQTRRGLTEKYKTCFNKIKLIEKPMPVIHSPRSILIHIFSLYKAKLENVEEEDIIRKNTSVNLTWKEISIRN